MNALLAPWPPPGMALRPMGVADLPAVVAVEQDIYPFPWTAGNFADSLEAGHEAWLLEADGQPVAYALQMPVIDEVHLLNLAVAAQWQGRGLGARLLEWLCAGAVDVGACAMFLEVRPSNVRAQALYQRSGFRQVGLRRRYYPSWNHEREDAIVMRRELGSPSASGGMNSAGP